MHSKFGGLAVAVSSASLLLSGCGSPLEQTTAAMGGQALEKASVERVVSTVVRYDPGESTAPGKNVKASDVTLERLLDLSASRRSNTRFNLATDFFPGVKLDYREIINGNTGYVDGLDSTLGGPAKAAMPGGRLAVRDREGWLLSPARLLKFAKANAGKVKEEAAVTREGKSYEVLSVTVDAGAPFKVLVDPSTHRVARVETLEDHPPMGDVLVAAVFEDYKDVGGVKVPGRITVYADEYKIHEETRTESTLPASVEESAFTVPQEFQQAATDPDLKFGTSRGQWLSGLGYLGLSFFFNDLSGAPVLFSELAPGLQLIGGSSHNSLLVEMSDHLVLVDAPLYEGRSLPVLAEIKKKYPTKPVRKVVLTHFHYDHIGGVRTFAAEGTAQAPVEVYVQATSASFMDSVMKRPHTLLPDELEKKKATAKVEVKSVDTMVELTDSAGKKVQLRKLTTTHAEDMLLVYVPDAKVAFQSDLYNPDPNTNGQPAQGAFLPRVRELYNGIKGMNLDVAGVAGGHGTGTATLDQLKSSAGL